MIKQIIIGAILVVLAAEGCSGKGDDNKPACVVGKVVARELISDDKIRIHYLDSRCREVKEDISTDQDLNGPYACEPGTYPDHAAAGKRRGKVITFPDCLKWDGEPGMRLPTGEAT